MPKGPVPDSYTDLLENTILGHLATIDERGKPNVNPVWFLWDGAHVLLSVKADTRKYRSLRNNSNVAMSFLDPANNGRYLEIRGEVTAFELYEDFGFVNLLARKYTGADFQNGTIGEQRYKLTIQVNSWTGQ